MTERICSCCKVSKPFTNEFYYTDGHHAAKCRACKNIKIGNKNTVDFMENLTENWKNHPEFLDFYFERDTNRIFNTETGKYLNNIRSFRNITKKDAKDIKWTIFNGDILENQIVKIKKDYNINSINLDSLECVYIYCDECNEIIQNPSYKSVYCSTKCQKKIKNKRESESRNKLHNYVMFKYSAQKTITQNIDYNIDYLISLGKTCFYCNIECTIGNKVACSDALTFDKKHCDLGYNKQNIVPCCWFCNTSKNITKYEDWLQFIDFIKNPDIFVLDLSNKVFYTNPKKLNISNIYYALYRECPTHYENSDKAREVFLELVKKQHYKDSIFNFFPIIYLDRNCLWNASIDAIDSTLQECDKHRPDNLQIIPKCFNYAKHVHSQEEFLKEWTKRGFKTDFSGCTVKLDEKYTQECYFHKIITR